MNAIKVASPRDDIVAMIPLFVNLVLGKQDDETC